MLVAWLLVALAATALGAEILQQPLLQEISTIPPLGFGTWNLDKSNATEAVSTALQVGYRHLDCATIYGNQKAVGEGIKDGLEKVGLKRSDIWVTSKLWNDHHDPAKVEEALNDTLADLGVDYLDLWLMHWPVASWPNHQDTENYIDAWQVMAKLQKAGRVRNIGVSNFSPAQVKDLIATTGTKPAVHQFEIHPYLPQSDWIKWHSDHGIAVTAYSPFANTNPTYTPEDDDPPLLLTNPVLLRIAARRRCTTAQVALVWGMSRGTIVIPKSSHADHIKENLGALECTLKSVDLDSIDYQSETYLRRFNNPSKSYGVKLFQGLEDS
ncbi:MAG: hypothetical protein Q9222_006068 [Ikaeria aurantiellina]